jgi:hypothetical protein
MPCVKKKFYCVICCNVKESASYGTLEQHQQLRSIFVSNTTCLLPNLICSNCKRSIAHPFEIVLRDGSIARVLHTTSRILTALSHSRKKPRGLLSLDPIPKGSYLPYPGKLIDEIQYETFKKKYGVEFSHEWARGGPKNRGARTILLGQYGTGSPRACAHFVNCTKGTDMKSNCAWGVMKMDKHFLETYPTFEASIAPNEYYPGICTRRDILPGEELLISSYGGNFWNRMAREEAGIKRVIRPCILNPHQLETIEQTRGIKRARDQS